MQEYTDLQDGFFNTLWHDQPVHFDRASLAKTVHTRYSLFLRVRQQDNKTFRARQCLLPHTDSTMVPWVWHYYTKSCSDLAPNAKNLICCNYSSTETLTQTSCGNRYDDYIAIFIFCYSCQSIFPFLGGHVPGVLKKVRPFHASRKHLLTFDPGNLSTVESFGNCWN